jgi:hypothetical protein
LEIGFLVIELLYHLFGAPGLKNVFLIEMDSRFVQGEKLWRFFPVKHWTFCVYADILTQTSQTVRQVHNGIHFFGLDKKAPQTHFLHQVAGTVNQV